MTLDDKRFPPVLLASGVVLRLAVALQDPVHLQRWPLDDDSFYYFNVAWNLTHGAGLRHDSFNTTTGFQPLFLLLISPVFWLAGTKLKAMTLALLFQTAIALGGGVSLYRLGRQLGRNAGGLLLAAVWAVSPTFLKVDLNGMETSLTLYLLVLTINFYLARFVTGSATTAHYVTLGALCGLGFLARIDFALFVLVIVADIARRRVRDSPPLEVARRITLLLLVCSACGVPWLLLNAAIGGSLLPTSGQAVRLLSQALGFRLLGGSNGSSGNYFPVDQIPLAYYIANVRRGIREVYRIEQTVFPVWLGGVLLALWPIGSEAIGKLKTLWFLYASLLLLFVAYTCYIFGQWFFYRYFAPFSIGYLVPLAMAVAELTRPEHRALRARRAALLIVPAAALAVLLSQSLQLIRWLPAEAPHSHYVAALWVNAHTPPGAIVGSFQSGIFGYFVERRFYGLDGKINRDALLAMKQKRMDRYVVDRHIDYLVDWSFILNDFFVRRSEDESFLGRQSLMTTGDFEVYRLTSP